MQNHLFIYLFTLRATATPEQLLAVVRKRSVASAREIGKALGVSQPSVSRLLARTGERVVRVGRGPSTRYAATRLVYGLGTDWPIYRIDRRGQAHTFGQLIALYGGGALVRADRQLPWLRDDFAAGLFPGLPWFLDTLRPQGFLGAQIAHRLATEIGLPNELSRWDADAVLAALLLQGADGPGNFVLGDHALRTTLNGKPNPIPLTERAERYADLAVDTSWVVQAGSSAAGEQPKFTALVADDSTHFRQVIVKFNEPRGDQGSRRRWADLLVCEHLAAELLAEAGHSAATTQLLRAHDRLFLESTRFDRVGARGRIGVITMAAWDDAYRGLRDDWMAAAKDMRSGGWVSADAVHQIATRWWFGRLIGNTDMHFGNLTFFLDDLLPLRLAPSYDMLPMAYRPAGTGVTRNDPLDPPLPLPAERSSWQVAAGWAQRYWYTIANQSQVSGSFRRLATANGVAIATARDRIGLSGRDPPA